MLRLSTPAECATDCSMCRCNSRVTRGADGRICSSRRSKVDAACKSYPSCGNDEDDEDEENEDDDEDEELDTP